MYAAISNTTNLKGDLEKFQVWAYTMQMKFNPDKFKVTHMEAQMKANGSPPILQETMVESDLGVMIDKRLTF